MSTISEVKETLTFQGKDGEQTVDLYSEQGMELVSQLWIKLCTQNKLMYELTWMGRPIIQLPNDIVLMQELIWKIKPDVIVETGIAHGGSLIYYASLLELIGKGRVVGIDVDIREHNRVEIEKHPMFKRITMFQNSSIAPEAIEQIKNEIQGAQTVLVTLDSNHSKEHVLKELALYGDMVTPGSYMVCMDGAQQWVADIPNGKSEWKEDNPLKAIEEFVANNDQFEIDENYERLKVTANPKGYLRKVK